MEDCQKTRALMKFSDLLPSECTLRQVTDRGSSELLSLIHVLRYMPSGQRDHIPTPRPMLLSWKHKNDGPVVPEAGLQGAAVFLLCLRLRLVASNN
ncbi:hypothetical protein EYF80_034638 [Liparis tanakae]|uniref:Uncharacterized protein n=1 Tax=Liparis tanakae TaxID=230148 RepID=A0A4Z2GQZ7_9TELE|nr:hypothetical protein EYF80_034638 [Liparis tanakae]